MDNTGNTTTENSVKARPLWFFVTFIVLISGIVSVFSASIQFFVVYCLFQGIEASESYLLGRSMSALRYSGMQSPLVGIGDVLHSTAIAFIILTIITFLFAIASRKVAADL